MMGFAAVTHPTSRKAALARVHKIVRSNSSFYYMNIPTIIFLDFPPRPSYIPRTSLAEGRHRRRSADGAGRTAASEMRRALSGAEIGPKARIGCAAPAGAGQRKPAHSGGLGAPPGGY